jgi:hypothetical protein
VLPATLEFEVLYSSIRSVHLLWLSESVLGLLLNERYER